MTAHGLQIVRACAVIDRAYKEAAQFINSERNPPRVLMQVPCDDI